MGQHRKDASEHLRGYLPLSGIQRIQRVGDNRAGAPKKGDTKMTEPSRAKTQRGGTRSPHRGHCIPF